MTTGAAPCPSPLERLEIEMRRAPFHAFLAPCAVSVDDGTKTVVVAIDFQPAFGHTHGAAGYHGGVVAALADIAGHAAVAVWHGGPAPTIDLRIDYLRPVSGERLEAVGHLRKLGRSVATADVEIRAGDRLIALGRGTFSTAAKEAL